MKSISTFNPAITENKEYTIINMCAPAIDIKVSASFNKIMTMLCSSSSSSNVLLTFQQSITKKASLLALHLPKSHNEAITCVPQIVTYAAVEIAME